MQQQPITITIPHAHIQAAGLVAVCERMLFDYGWHNGTTCDDAATYIYGQVDSAVLNRLRKSAEQNQFDVKFDEVAA
jgi:hypothetical protein